MILSTSALLTLLALISCSVDGRQNQPDDNQWIGPLEESIDFWSAPLLKTPGQPDGSYILISSNGPISTYSEIQIAKGIRTIGDTLAGSSGGLIILRSSDGQPDTRHKFHIIGIDNDLNDYLYQVNTKACYLWGVPRGRYLIMKFDMANDGRDLAGHIQPSATVQTIVTKHSIHLFDFDVSMPLRRDD